jgi:hypothetical protein
MELKNKSILEKMLNRLSIDDLITIYLTNANLRNAYNDEIFKFSMSTLLDIVNRYPVNEQTKSDLILEFLDNSKYFDREYILVDDELKIFDKTGLKKYIIDCLLNGVFDVFEFDTDEIISNLKWLFAKSNTLNKNASLINQTIEKLQ